MNSEKKILPSILSADFGRLAQQISECEKAGAGMIHFDVMDGHFVPNITIGPPVLQSIRGTTSLEFSVHLMIENPSQYVPHFAKAGADYLSIHYEAVMTAGGHLDRELGYIRDEGAKAGIALNPATPVSLIEHVLDKVDFVLVMSVNPGFGGQKFIEYAVDKIRDLDNRRKNLGFDYLIEVDGGINSKTAPLVAAAGADLLVAGNAVFRHPDGIEKGIAEIRSSLK